MPVTKTKIHKRAIALKIDPELDRFVRTQAEAEGTSQIAIHERALSFEKARIDIERHLRNSLYKNMRMFHNNFAGFCEWLSREGKTSNFGGRKLGALLPDSDITILNSVDQVISFETFNLLRMWQAEPPEKREDFMNYVVLRYELWFRPEDLTGELFPEMAEATA